MKVESKPLAPVFNPFQLTITVENLEEAKGLYWMFNFTPITECSGFSMVNHERVRSALADQVSIATLNYGFTPRVEAMDNAMIQRLTHNGKVRIA